MFKAVIFDLDGTLVHSLPGITNALNRSLAELGLPQHNEDTVRTFIGDGAWKLCERSVSEPTQDIVEQVSKGFRKYYDADWRSGTQEFEGISPLLSDLTQRNTPVAVLSNKPHHATVEIVENLFSQVEWSSVLGQREHIPKKPHPSAAFEIAELLKLSPSEIAFVGDSTVDIETAHAAGMTPIAVTWGYHNEKDLRSHEAIFVNSVSELRNRL